MVIETLALAGSFSIAGAPCVLVGDAVVDADSPPDPQADSSAPRASAGSSRVIFIGEARPGPGASDAILPGAADGQIPAARRAAACAASSNASSSGASSAGGTPSAVAVSQSANQEFLGSSGPWRYVPTTVPCAPPRTPSYPDPPSLPCPLRTRPSAFASPSRVPPPWFSNPA